MFVGESLLPFAFERVLRRRQEGPGGVDDQMHLQAGALAAIADLTEAMGLGPGVREPISLTIYVAIFTLVVRVSIPVINAALSIFEFYWSTLNYKC